MGKLRNFAVLTILALAIPSIGCGGADANNPDQPPVTSDDGGLDSGDSSKPDVKPDGDAGGDVKDTGTDVKDGGKDADADVKPDAKEAGPDAKETGTDGDTDAEVDGGDTDGGDTDAEVDGGDTDGGDTDAEVDGGDTDAEVDGDTDAQVDGEVDGGELDTGIDVVEEPQCTIDDECNDNVFCNGVETCSNQHCVPGTAPSCADAYTCTDDFCDENAKACGHTPNNGLCDNGLHCDGAETCDPNNGASLTGCVLGTAPDCNDGYSCTTDSCDEANDTCAHVGNDGACTNNDACDGVETCAGANGGAAVTGCLAGSAPNCDDGYTCTADTCNAQTGCVHTADDTACVDTNLCNGTETCAGANGGAAVTGCKAGTDLDCNDTFSCTADTCVPATGCVHTADDTACVDTNLCNGTETCAGANGGTPGTGCKAGTDLDCNDTYSCTTDTCNPASGCVHTPSDAACSDSSVCTGTETCAGANGGAAVTGCKAGTPLNCDDTYSCTTDTCHAVNGCVNTPSDAACSDSDACTGIETCVGANGGTAGTGCKAGTPLVCNDGYSCTTDTCAPATGCVFTPSDAACDDLDWCTGTETCAGANGGTAGTGCKAGTAPDCADTVPCTVDSCSSSTQSCIHTATDSLCQDGTYCNGNERCDQSSGCQPALAPVNCDDSIPCTTDACDEGQKKCTHTANDASCSDNKYCTGVETCSLTLGCQPGTPVNCDDSRSCTVDACSDSLASCTHTPQNAACDDTLYCNGVETCSATGPVGTGCLSGTAVTCAPDGIACTVDQCDEPTDSCVYIENNALCPSGQFCVIAQHGCTAGTPCTDAAQCQDGDLCNGTEQCISSICQPGAPKNCDDGIVCTIDDCTPSTGVCTHQANSAFCDDNLKCNGTETCDPVGGNPTTGCKAGTPVVCADAFTCTDDTCVEPTGTCASTPNDFNCDDGKLCNGQETCAPSSGGAVGTGCKAGTAYVCPTVPGGCSTQVCDDVLNACKGIPDDSKCPCGQTCDVQLGCGNYCQTRTCQGKIYECGDCLDNDGDCRIDNPSDNMCLGPCDNSEESYNGEVPGANSAPCKQDCYFDGDTGAGNDDCYWDHQCDPLEVAPNYPPEDKCDYKPNTKITPTITCADAMASQSATCLNYCRPLTPNGCDCFGCCEIPGAPTTVWLGSENPSGTSSCHAYIAGPPIQQSTVTDPLYCKPCTQVTSCLNTCAHCELCVGKPTLPIDCVEQECPTVNGVPLQKCGMAGQAPCPAGNTCITGCCVTNPS